VDGHLMLQKKNDTERSRTRDLPWPSDAPEEKRYGEVSFETSPTARPSPFEASSTQCPQHFHMEKDRLTKFHQ
ncbi:hypothetical protein Tco_0043983, partial [Tanacetum coccineum]